MKFRKKPIVVEAKQVTLENLKEIAKWGEGKIHVLPFGMRDGLLLDIETVSGNVFARDKDWVIKGVEGEFYPCKPDIFEATYERVED